MEPLYLSHQDKKVIQDYTKKLNSMIEKARKLSSNEVHLCWLWKKFIFSDVDNEGNLEKKELQRFFTSINHPMKSTDKMGSNKRTFEQLWNEKNELTASKY